MTTATARADLSFVKAHQQKTWASGDYAVIASRIVLVSELLADAADLQAGWEVLDVACGNGNTTLAASVRRTCTWRFTSPEEFVWFFRRWYGPALKAFEVLEQDGRAALAHDLAQLARHWGRNHGGGIAIPATYLETILTLR
jgi:hypothetical protein